MERVCVVHAFLPQQILKPRIVNMPFQHDDDGLHAVRVFIGWNDVFNNEPIVDHPTSPERSDVRAHRNLKVVVIVTCVGFSSLRA